MSDKSTKSMTYIDDNLTFDANINLSPNLEGTSNTVTYLTSRTNKEHETNNG